MVTTTFNTASSNLAQDSVAINGRVKESPLMVKINQTTLFYMCMHI